MNAATNKGMNGMKTIQLGMNVRLITTKKGGAKTGRVFEIDPIHRRARVEWLYCPRTWMSFDKLEIMQSESR